MNSERRDRRWGARSQRAAGEGGRPAAGMGWCLHVHSLGLCSAGDTGAEAEPDEEAGRGDRAVTRRQRTLCSQICWSLEDASAWPPRDRFISTPTPGACTAGSSFGARGSAGNWEKERPPKRKQGGGMELGDVLSCTLQLRGAGGVREAGSRASQAAQRRSKDAGVEACRGPGWRHGHVTQEVSRFRAWS